MASVRDLVLFGLVFCSFLVCTIASVGGFSGGGNLLPRTGEYGSSGIDAEHFVSGRRSLKQRGDKCDSSSTDQRAIAYYESWASRRKCNTFKPSDIDPSRWTHINFAFAVLDWSGKVIPSSSDDVGLYKETTSLKDKTTDLKVYIAVGGFGKKEARRFSRMASQRSSRKDFIHSAKKFMDEHNFDGIDIDWEYPAAYDRGGRQSDTENLVELVKEMKKEFGDKKGISVTVPAKGHYLQGFNLEKMQEHIDMINFMSYDLHGSWERPLLAQPGTNLTEIDQAVQQLQGKGVSLSKVNLGLAYYGYAYVLSEESCKEPGCPASSAVRSGPCGRTQGTLDIHEIQHIMKDNDVNPQLNKDAAIMYFTYGQNHWVSYDNNETLQMKTDYARDNCLGGSFVWAVDMENPNDRMMPVEVKTTSTGQKLLTDGDGDGGGDGDSESDSDSGKSSSSSSRMLLGWSFLVGSFFCSFFFSGL